MPNQRVSIAELKRLQRGSTAAHHALVADCLFWLKLKRIPARPISTTGIPIRLDDGRIALKPNQRQEGMSDVLATLPPGGRTLLLEMKTGAASRSTAQRELQAEFEQAGALCLVVRSVEGMAQALTAIGAFTRLSHNGSHSPTTRR
jgi:hypothetical protein